MIKTWQQRCEEHLDHQQGIVTQQMIQDRMQEEIDELRQALAQPEQENVSKNMTLACPSYLHGMGMEGFKMTELRKEGWTPVEIGVDITADGTHVVGMYVLMPEGIRHVFYSKFHPAPPKREWVGITKEDKKEILEMTQPDERGYVIAITEAKLKEKNA